MASADKQAAHQCRVKWQHYCLAMVLVLATAIAAQQAVTGPGTDEFCC